MQKKCEVVGWLLLEPDAAQMLVREENGQMSAQRVTAESELGDHAIQTGVFERGNPIVDPTTGQTIGYELQRISGPIASLR